MMPSYVIRLECRRTPGEARKCNLNLFSQTSITKATGIFFVV